MRMAYALFVAKALFWATLAAVIVAEIFLQGDLDRFIAGFLAGCSFSFVMAFFHHDSKERFGHGFVNFPKR